MGQFDEYRNHNEYEFFGRAVACTRIERGYKRKELCARAGMSYPYLAEIEQGRKMPAHKKLAELAAALGVAPAALLTRADQLQEQYG